MLKRCSILRAVLTAMLILCGLQVFGQQDVAVLRGRVTCGGRAVPYATLQLKGTSVGVACNDDGEYRLKVPAGHEEDTVVVRSVGYVAVKLTVAQLIAKGDVRLREQSVSLREVKVESYRTPQHLLEAAKKRFAENYCQQTAWSTFFYRDWRAVDGELYLFDEAVMSVRRAGYGSNANKEAYRFDSDRRELKSNYKSVLRHRMVVHDRVLLDDKVGDPQGEDELLQYADNEEFYDPVATPRASFALSHSTLAMHKFEPIQEFLDGDDVYYLLRSVGPGRMAKIKVRYTYTVRKSDLAIVAITAAVDSANVEAGSDSWINIKYDRMALTTDSSSWRYDVRDGRYTLTHYYNERRVVLGYGDRFRFRGDQEWRQCVDWTLTDFTTTEPSVHGDTIYVRQQTLAEAFGASDYDGDYWGRYNSVPVDMLPLRMLREKLMKIKNKTKQ